jgi:S-adenosylmethionine uptake transporter
MVAAGMCFSAMGVAVKWASPQYGAGEIVFYRSLVGLVVMSLVLRAQGHSPATTRPWLHVSRSASGTIALLLWTYCIGGVALGTAMTLNYMSSLWMGAILLVLPLVGLRNGDRPDARLLLAVLLGFGGVALVLAPWAPPAAAAGASTHPGAAAAGLLSGLLAAVAYLQVGALGRAGEPQARIVFWFALCGVVLGLAAALASGGLSGHDARGAALLLAIGLLATAGQWCITAAYRDGHALVNAALHYLGIVFGLGFGAWLFAEQPEALALLGTALIVAAGLWATLLRDTR